jgi:hypothetical protein
MRYVCSLISRQRAKTNISGRTLGSSSPDPRRQTPSETGTTGVPRAMMLRAIDIHQTIGDRSLLVSVVYLSPSKAECMVWCIYTGSAWQYDSTTDEYYLHLYAPQQPDLNWTNPEVREAVWKMMEWWLERGVDGFRVCASHLIDQSDF